MIKLGSAKFSFKIQPTRNHKVGEMLSLISIAIPEAPCHSTIKMPMVATGSCQIILLDWLENHTRSN
jgi:hypothetical protein